MTLVNLLNRTMASKKQKIEASENELLAKAIACAWITPQVNAKKMGLMEVDQFTGQSSAGIRYNNFRLSNVYRYCLLQ